MGRPFRAPLRPAVGFQGLRPWLSWGAPSGLPRARMPRIAPTASLLFLLFATVAFADEGLDRKVLESEAWRRGDYVGLFDEWLGIMTDHPDAPQVEVILRAWKNVEVFVPDPSAFLPKLVALEGKLTGPNAFHLRANLARLLDETGDYAAAHDVRAKDGDLAHWRVAGPYGRTAGACFETAYPPERGAEADWRAYPGPSPIIPFRYLRPLRGAAYARCQVKADADVDAFLWITSTGPVRVWWNGGVLPDIDRLRAWLPKTLTVPLHLTAGWNAVVVKSIPTEEGFRVRILDAHGEPLRLVEEEGDEVHPCGAPAGGAAWSPWGALVGYEASARSGSEDGWAAAMRSFLLSEEGVPDRALAAGLASVAALSKSAPLACLLGEMYDSADHLPESERKNRAKDWYEKALSLDPAFVPALEDLSLYYKRDHQSEKSLATLRRAAEINPKHFAGPYVSAGILRDEGWASEARHAFEELERRAPGNVASAEGLAGEAVALGSYAEALAAFEKLGTRSASARRQRAALLRATGRLDEALAATQAELTRDPTDPAGLAVVAGLLAEAGRLGEAAEAYRRAWALAPGDPSLPRRMAELAVREGKDEEAAALLAKALAVEPSDEASRALLDELTGESEDVPEAYRVNVGAAIHTAPAAVGAPVDHLFRQLVVRLRADGSATVWTHDVVRLNTAEAIDAYGEVPMLGTILAARNVLPDGRSLVPSQIGEKGTLTLPGLVIGSVVDTAFRREMAPDEGGLALAFFFHDQERNGPVARVRFAVEWPDQQAGLASQQAGLARSMPIEIRERHFDAHREVAGSDAPAPKGFKARVWEAAGLPMLERQSKSPPDEDLLPWVLVAERRTWADVVEGLRETLSGRTRLTEEIARVAAEQAKGRATDREKAEAAYRFAQTWIKDTSGNGDAQEILSTRSGPVLFLASAILDAMGVRHEWVAVRPREDLVGDAVWDVPRSDVFSSGRVTTLLRVPLADGALWLSGDARLLAPGQLSEMSQGGVGLVLDPAQPRFVTVPTAPPEAMGNAVAIEAALDADGTLAGKTRFELRGVAAAAYKDRLLGVEAPQRKMIFQTLLANFFLGFQLEEMTLPELETPGTPLVVDTTFRTPSFARTQNGKMEAPGPYPLSHLRKSFCRERDRTVPLRLAAWQVTRTDAAIRIPDGWRVTKLPDDALLQGSIGRLSITWRREGNVVRVRHELEMGPQVLAPARYGELVRFCTDADAAEEQRMELTR